MKKILLTITFLIAQIAFSQISGKLIPDNSIPSSKVIGGTGGGTSSANIFVPISASDFTSPNPANANKVWDIQNNITITGDCDFSSVPNIIFKDGGGKITFQNNNVKFNNAGFDFPYNRVVMDFSSTVKTTVTKIATGGETTWNLGNNVAIDGIELIGNIFPTELRVNGVEQDYGTILDVPLGTNNTFTIAYGTPTIITFRNGLSPLTAGQSLAFDYVAIGDYATIDDTSTFQGGDINIVAFGLVNDGNINTNTGTDNRNVFLQVQKIFNKTGGTGYIKGNGTYMLECIEEKGYNGELPTNIYITGSASLKFDKNVTIGALRNNLPKYRMICAHNSVNGKIEGGTLVGDLKTHIWNGEYDEGCHGIMPGGNTRNLVIRDIVIKDFPADCINPYVITEAIHTGILESSFTAGAKNTFILPNGTKTNEVTSTYIGTDWSYSQFFSLSDARFASAGQMMIGGNSSYAGNGGLLGNTFYIAYYSNITDGATGEYTFIERTDLVENYQILNLKPEYKYFRIITLNPLVWANLELTVFAPKIPLYTTVENVTMERGVRQGYSNISPYTVVNNSRFLNNGARYDGKTGSPAYHIDVEDFYQGNNNITVSNSVFGNAKQGILILKGTKFFRFTGNTVLYPDNPKFAGRFFSTANGHDTSVDNNVLRSLEIITGRRDKYDFNRIYDSSIAPRLEDEIFSNHVNAYNVRFSLTQTDIGTNISTFKDNYWTYDKPLEGSGKAINTIMSPNLVWENNVFDFNNIPFRSNQKLAQIITSDVNNWGIGKGYLYNHEIRNLFAETGSENTQYFEWIVQPITRLKTSLPVRISQGVEQDVEFNDWEIKGFVNLTLDYWTSDNTAHKNITINNPKITITNASVLDSNNALMVASKDANIQVNGGFVKIKIGTNANADNFLSLLNTGTKVFNNVTFYTDQASSTQALNSSYTFNNCTFVNITFTGATIN